MNRRRFAQSLALGLTGASLRRSVAAETRKLSLEVGHTGITWPGGRVPGSGVDAGVIEAIFRDISSLGFHGIELFSWQIEGLEATGNLGRLIEKYNLPLISSYTGYNLTDPAQRKDAIAGVVRVATIVKKHGGRIIVVGPSGRGPNYVFADHKANIVATLNESGKAVSDLGLTAVLHQHTGTCIETRDETYAVMEATDRRFLKFGPDIGQLQKGGADPVQVVKDWLPTIHHLHLKDWVGGPVMAGYCPLGQGKVDLPAILALMNGRQMDGMVMVELDSGGQLPMPPAEMAGIARRYLQSQGVSLKS